MVCNKKRKPVFIKRKWNQVVFSGATILSFHLVHIYIYIYSLSDSFSTLSDEALEYSDCVFVEGKPPLHYCPRCNLKMHLMVRLQSGSFGKCEVPLHCHYSQVHSDREVIVTVRVLSVEGIKEKYLIICLTLYHFIIIIIMSCRQHGYPWPSFATSPYRSSPLAGLQGYIPYPHRAVACMFELTVLLLLGHMWGP